MKISTALIRNVLIFTFLVLCYSDVLRRDLYLISWLVAVTLVLFLKFKKGVMIKPSFYLGVAFCFLVLINSFVAEDSFNTFVRFLKLMFIMLLVNGVFLSSVPVNLVTRASYCVVFSNLIMVLLNIFGYSEFAFVAGGLRWETILSGPGTLYYPAVLMLAFIGSDLFLRTKFLGFRNFYFYVFSAVMCLALIVLDGARTSIILLAVASLLIFFFSDIKSKLMKILLLAFVSVFFGWEFGDLIPGMRDSSRIFALLGSGSIGDDIERQELLDNAINWIYENNPIFLGKGFSSTVKGENFELVVHNAYVLVWEQLGLVALIVSILIFTLPVLVSVKKYYRYKDRRFIMPLICFVLFSFQLLLHPLATEYGPWVYFFVGFLLLGNLNNNPTARQDSQ